HVAVVAPGELHDLRPARVSAGQTDCGHGRLGARGHETDLVDGVDPGHDLLGEFDLTGRGGAEGEPLDGGFLHGGEHLGARVAQDHRAPGADEVDVVVAVGVTQPGAG